MNVMVLGVYGIIFLLLIGLISNFVSYVTPATACTSTSTDTYCNNYIQMTVLSCHMPIRDGWDNSTSIDTNRPDLIFNGNGTYYDCGFNTSGQYTARYPRDYTATEFSAIPTGWLNFAGDTLTQFFYKTGAIISLIIGFMTPINFNILGYGIADIGTFAGVVIISIYGLCYLFIGIMVYKVFSPFSGAS